MMEWVSKGRERRCLFVFFWEGGERERERGRERGEVRNVGGEGTCSERKRKYP